MKEIKLTYEIFQRVYVVEFDTKLKKYKMYEQSIKHIDIGNGEINYYTTFDGDKDDICISEYWTGLRTCSRQKFLKQNPECINGDVFSNAPSAKKYLNKMNKSIFL